MMALTCSVQCGKSSNHYSSLLRHMTSSTTTGTSRWTSGSQAILTSIWKQFHDLLAMRLASNLSSVLHSSSSLVFTVPTRNSSEE